MKLRCVPCSSHASDGGASPRFRFAAPAVLSVGQASHSLGSQWIVQEIEALADAGGVFVSNTVHDQVRDRLPFVFEDLGEQQVKNIARPVRIYRVRDLGAKSPALPVPCNSAPPFCCARKPTCATRIAPAERRP